MGPQRPQNFHTISLGLLVLLPILMFLLISFFLLYLSHSAQAAIWVAVAVCLLVSLVFMSARKTSLRDGPNFWFNLGVLCFAATVAATAAGVYNWRSHAARYWAYQGQRSYSNVLPGEPALSHIDAGSISFSADARLDLASTGRIRADKRLLCVVPVVGNAQQQVVNYWAAGVNCCPLGSNFTCGAAGNSGARGGLVYLRVGRFASADLGGFKRAAEEAAAAHGLSSSPDALFLQWVEDVEQAELAFWNDGIHFLVCSICIHAAISLVIGTMMHCCRRAPAKNKLDDGRLTF